MATRSQVLAAQLLEELNSRLGREVPAGVARMAQAGRDAGVQLPPVPTDDPALSAATQEELAPGHATYATHRQRAKAKG